MKLFRKHIALMLALALCLVFAVPVASAAGDLPEYDHAWCFQHGDKQKPEGAAAGTDKVYTYEYGVRGTFAPLTKYRSDWGTYGAWTLDGNPPSVADWFLSGSGDNDGAIVWTAPRDMSVEISSTTEVKLDGQNASKCDGVGIMVLQQSGKQFHPLWPSAGNFTWYDVKASGSTKLSGLHTQVKAGERLLFVVHSLGDDSVGDTVDITPKVVQTAGQAAYPSGFQNWPNQGSSGGATTAPPSTAVDPFANPTQLSVLFSKESATIGPLSLQSGYDGEYQSLTLYRNDWHCWTAGGSSPAIGADYMGAFAKHDAVVMYTAPKAGTVKVTSAIPLELDWPNESDGVTVMVLVKNRTGERPLWPSDGKWEWERIDPGEQVKLPEITAYMEKDDQIHVILRSIGGDVHDSMKIDPIFDLDPSKSGKIPQGVERTRPTDDDYTKALLDLPGTLDPPAGSPNGGSGSPASSQSGGSGLSPVWIVVIAVGGVLIVACAVVTVCLIRKKKRAKAGEPK